MKPERHERLIDIGSTTALSAMVEIVGNRTDGGTLARQAQAMLSRLDPEDAAPALEGFCDELQTFLESVPGAVRSRRSEAPKARRRPA